MKPYPNEELDRMSKREIIRLYKRTVEQFSDAVPVRHGYWRSYKDEHTCSCCGETITGDWYDKDNDTYWYCPWCGAKMDAERRNDEID